MASASQGATGAMLLAGGITAPDNGGSTSMGAFGSINAHTTTEVSQTSACAHRGGPWDRDRKGKRRPWNLKLVGGHSQSQRGEQRHLHDYRGNSKLPDHTDNRGGHCGKPGERYVCGQFQPDQRQRFILGRSHAVAIRAANQRREVLRGLPFFVSGPSIASERRRQSSGTGNGFIFDASGASSAPVLHANASVFAQSRLQNAVCRSVTQPLSKQPPQADQRGEQNGGSRRDRRHSPARGPGWSPPR